MDTNPDQDEQTNNNGSTEELPPGFEWVPEGVISEVAQRVTKVGLPPSTLPERTSVADMIEVVRERYEREIAMLRDELGRTRNALAALTGHAFHTQPAEPRPARSIPSPYEPVEDGHGPGGIFNGGM